MCAPSGITDVEKRAIVEASLSAGARKVNLIEETIAAAIGAGLAIEEPVGNMVVDVGGGTSEVAVISLGGIVVSESARVGGYDLDEAIMAHVKQRHGITIGQQTAEHVKFEIGSAWPVEDDLTAEVKGRDLVSGLPKTVTLTAEEVRGALEEPLRVIIGTIRETLERTPPELAADVVPARDHAGRRRVAAEGLRRARAGRDQDVDLPGGLPADVRGDRLGALAGGVRRDERSGLGRIGSAQALRAPPVSLRV